MFGMAEQFNRETTFIAAYQRAIALGADGMNEAYHKLADLNEKRGMQPPSRTPFSSPFEFAKDAVNQTQFVLSKAARPNFARGTVGATLFTFKSFGLYYVELLHRMPNKERAMMLGTLVLMAGIGGIPFSDDLDDLIDTLGQAAGYATNSKKWKDAILTEAFGKVGNDFVSNGISAFLPLDLQTRLGFGNLIPGTGMLKKSNSGYHAKDLEELLGAAGGYYKQVTDAWDYTLAGRYGDAMAQAFLPKAMKDAAKAINMLETGYYEDTHCRRVTDVTPLYAVIKAVGFQPTDVSAISDVKSMEMQDIMLLRKVKQTISEMWAIGVHEHDTDASTAARNALSDWNDKNPEMRIQIKPASILQRVKQMQSTAQERMIHATPKEMKAGVRAAFSDQ